jgi:uncharacterized damage-inducible protein DinB
MHDLRYPIGSYEPPNPITPEQREEWIAVLASAPARLADAVAGLSPEQLDSPYRDGGWTVRQVVHHVPDSHMNSYVRFMWALSEDTPTIKAYDEVAWAEVADARTAPIEPSLALLERLHGRWVLLLRSLTESQWQREFVHPEGGRIDLATNLGAYAWHGRHHTAHITSLRERMGW